MTGADLFLRAWTFDPFAIAFVALSTSAYSIALRGRHGARAVWFALAMLLVLAALVSPIGTLAHGYLFSAHMLQHLLLVLAVPPLVLLSLPRDGARVKASSAALSIRSIATWASGVGAMWLWHAPTLCNAASQNASVLRTQALSLIVMGGLFFWPILAPRASSRLSTFGGMLYLFTACTACTILGIFVTFSPVEVCSVFAHPIDRLGAMPLLRDAWGLTPKVDQEIGGLMMWVPGCLVYAACIVGTYGKYAREELVPAGKREAKATEAA